MTTDAQRDPRDVLEAEIARLREANRKLHRRAQQIEAPPQSLASQRKHLEALALGVYRTKAQDFDRLIGAHKELQRIFRQLARVYSYPQDATSMHSCMDSKEERSGEPRESGAVYANCFTLPSGIKSYRVLDEVTRAVDELIEARARTIIRRGDQP